MCMIDVAFSDTESSCFHIGHITDSQQGCSFTAATLLNPSIIIIIIIITIIIIIVVVVIIIIIIIIFPTSISIIICISTSIVIIIVIISLTDRFHVAVRLSRNRSQMTSKCGKNEEVRLVCH